MWNRTGIRPLPDDAARRAIVHDLDKNLLVEAAAGTGKTTSLVSRMVALIREGRNAIDEISAVTFTIKAAAELAQRFQSALEEARRQEKDLARKGLLEEALGHLDSGFVGTIHAFCARLLRERPVEAGVDPGFEELDETENALRRAEAWELSAQKLFAEANPLLEELTKHNLRLEDLRPTYETLSDNADVVPVASERPPLPDFSRERKAIDRFLKEAEKDLPGEPPEKGWDSLQRSLVDAIRLREFLDPARPPDFVRVLEALDRSADPVLNRWQSGSRAKRLAEELRELRRTVVGPALCHWREFVHPIAIAVLSPTLEEFRRRRLETGRLNFQDLLIFARDLLRDHPDARRDFQRRFPRLLVDEFQDTDPIQAEILLLLTGRDTSERNWHKIHPTPGSLFVVGDPKQSIYRFRRADIETYDRVKKRIQESDGEVISLTTNFRSSGNLCGWVNGVFAPVFPDSATREQAAHAPLSAFRPPGSDTSGAFRLEVSAAHSTPSELIVAEDADKIATWIRAAIDSGFLLSQPTTEGREKTRPRAEPEEKRAAQPGDFLILLRNRRNMRRYAQALETRGIAYEISGGGAFRDSEELAVLLPFLQALMDPDNPVFLVAALRGPLLGIDDRALYRFYRAKGRFSFLSEVPSGTDPRIARAYAMMREAQELIRRLPPGAAVAAIAERLGWIAHAASEELGETRAGNLLKAVTLARALSAQGEAYSDIVRKLCDLTKTGETEEMSTEPGRPRAVRLMTLHRAKGLEAPVVFLADPTEQGEHEIDFCIDRESDPTQAQGHFRILVKQGFKKREIARPPGWEARAEIERAFQGAEKDRLLYVAATRAAHMLAVSLQQRPNGTFPAGGAWAKFAPHLARALPEIPSRVGPQKAVSLAGTSRDLSAFRERLPSLRAAGAAPSYSVTRVTDLSHAAGGEFPFAGRTGRGLSWGRVLHRLLEALMRDAALDVAAYAANLLTEEERPPEDLEEAVGLVEGVRDSPLWQRALSARRRLVEVPFALKVPSADLNFSEGPPETLLQGVIDLVFEEASGWTIVDYKSDTIAGNFDELVRFYSPQISRYRRHWQQLTGTSTRAGLYFVQTGQESWLEERG